MTRWADGSVRPIGDFHKTQEGAAAAAKYALDKSQIEHQQKREEKLFEMRMKLLTTPVIEMDKLANKSQRFRTPKEVEAIIQQLSEGPVQPQGPAQPQMRSFGFEEMRNSLQSGTKYQGPDGQWRIKR